MRCLHCGKELALLKRLTGGGEFCSEAHKKSYQEEYNRIALSRLLQAQAKSVQPGPAQAVSEAPSYAAPMHAETAVHVGAEEPVAATAVAVEEIPVEELVVETPAEPELEATAMAEFVADSPVNVAAPAEIAPEAIEVWLEGDAAATAPDFLFECRTEFDLPSAPLAPLSLEVQAIDIATAVQEANVMPNEFTGSPGNPPAPLVITPVNSLREAGLVTVNVAPSTFTFRLQSTADSISFTEGAVEFHGSPLLNLTTARITFPAEDADIAFESSLAEGSAEEQAEVVAPTAPAEAAREAASEPVEESKSTPKESLEALAKLHEEMAEQETARQEQVQPVEAAAEPAVIEASVPIVVEPVAEEPVVVEPVAQEPVTVDAPAVETEPEASGEKEPRQADLRDMGLRIYAPPKPVPIDGSALVREAQALLPRLTALPLRPKVAFAPSQSPVKGTPQQKKASAPAKPSPVK